jgi:hypothetical protein
MQSAIGQHFIFVSVRPSGFDDAFNSPTFPFAVLAPPRINNATADPYTEGFPAAIRVEGGTFVTESNGCTAGSELLWDGQAIDSAQVVNGTQITATIPARLAERGPHTITILNPGGGRSNAFVLNLGPNNPIVIDTGFLPTGLVGIAYPSTPISATGGTGPLTWSLRPDNLGLQIGNDGVLSGVATRSGTFDVVVTATDNIGASASRDYRLLLLPAVQMQLSGVPANLQVDRSESVTLQVSTPYPVDLRGTLALAFTPEQGLPNVTGPDAFLSLGSTPQFANPVFTIPAGSLTITVPMQPGTSAGTVRIVASDLSAAGFQVVSGEAAALTTRLQAVPPQIQACVSDRRAGALNVRVTGISTTRDVGEAVFAFTPLAGSNLEPVELRSNVSSLFNTFYSGIGGAFVYDQQFTVDGDVNAIGSIRVTLSNARGSSATVEAQPCP